MYNFSTICNLYMFIFFIFLFIFHIKIVYQHSILLKMKIEMKHSLIKVCVRFFFSIKYQNYYFGFKYMLLYNWRLTIDKLWMGELGSKIKRKPAEMSDMGIMGISRPFSTTNLFYVKCSQQIEAKTAHYLELYNNNN